jgi:hypothetical protein
MSLGWLLTRYPCWFGLCNKIMLEVGIDDVDNLITLSNQRNAVEIYKKKLKLRMLHFYIRIQLKLNHVDSS